MLKKYKRDKMKKSLFMFVANQRGSLVGVIMALGLLGVAATGLFTYIQHFHKTSTQTAEQINFNPQFLTKVIGNMRSVLVDAQKDAAGVSEKGICALVKDVGLKIKKSVEIVTLDMTKLSSSVLDWNKFFPGPPPNGEWKEVQSSDTVAINRCKEVSKNFSVTDLMKCFEYKGAKEQGNKIYAVAQILPKKFPSGDDARNNNNLEARHAIFHLKASIGMVPFEDGSGSASKIVYSSTRSDILWANSAGSCAVAVAETCTVDADCSPGATCSGNVCSPKSLKLVKLSISSMVSTAEEGVLNAELDNQDSCAGLKIGALKPYATQGTKGLVPGTSIDNWVSKDEGSPVYMACVMKKFRCKNHTWVASGSTSMATFFDEGMHFTFQLDNDIGRPVTITKMNPTLGGHGTENPIAYAVYSLAPDHPFEVIEGGADEGKFKKITGISPYPSLFKEDSVDPNKLTLNIPPGGGQFKVIVRGNEACSPTNPHCSVFNVCDGVCQSGDNWYPQVQITVDDPKLGVCTPSASYSANNIECISCYAKSCHRLGQGTVGMRDTMPQEALDSQLPECRAAGAGNHDVAADREIASSDTFKGDTNEGDAIPSDGCIALNLDTDTDGNLDDSNSDGKLDVEENFKGSTFENKDCLSDGPYPVLCYANGRYQPATEWNNTAQAYELKEVSYDQAEKACYEMGKEVLNKVHLAEYMEDTRTGTFTNADICSGANCKFVNNATRGMFLLPTYDVGEISNKDLLIGKNFMWVAAELDKGGLVVATPLKADIATGSSDKYALFNNKDTSENYDPVLLEETAPSGGAGDPYALVYGVKYKGLMKRPKATLLRFICQKSNGWCSDPAQLIEPNCTGSWNDNGTTRPREWRLGRCSDPARLTEAGCTGSWNDNGTTRPRAWTSSGWCNDPRILAEGSCTGNWDHDGNPSTPHIDRAWIGGPIFFLSSTPEPFCNGSDMNGPDKCAAEDGYFVAPESALDYSRAMLSLKNAAANSNAPDPTHETTDDYAFSANSVGTTPANYVHTQTVADSVQAWVALKTDNVTLTCP